jgi:hypothetical protein
MSAIDDVLAMKKRAAIPGAVSDFGKDLGKALTGGVGAGLAGAAVGGAGIAASKIYDAMTKARDFRSMLGSSFNSDLHGLYKERPKEFNEAYSSLRSFNPAFAKDPMVAGVYMRRIMTLDPHGAGGALVESLQHRKAMPESPMQDILVRGGAEGAARGFAESVKSSGETAGKEKEFQRRKELEEEKMQRGEKQMLQQHDLGLRKGVWDAVLRKGGPSAAQHAWSGPDIGPFVRGESNQIKV